LVESVICRRLILPHTVVIPPPTYLSTVEWVDKSNASQRTTAKSIPILQFLPLGNYCAATIIFGELSESVPRCLDTVYESSYEIQKQTRLRGPCLLTTIIKKMQERKMFDINYDLIRIFLLIILLITNYSSNYSSYLSNYRVISIKQRSVK